MAGAMEDSIATEVDLWRFFLKAWIPWISDCVH